jgi:NitT/TauT family transport system substrate-binding protein
MRRLKRGPGRVAAFALAAAALLSQAVAAVAAPAPVKTIKQLTIYLAPLYVAADQGLDEKHGMKFELASITAGAQIPVMLLNGELDISTCTLDKIANLYQQGKHVVAFYLLLPHPTLDLAVSNRLVESSGVTPTSPLADRLAALKGRKFGISEPGSASDMFTRALLRSAGIGMDDVELVRTGTIPGLFAALKSGQIDGFMLSPPSPEQAEAAKTGKIWVRLTTNEVPALAHIPYMTFCAREDYAKAHAPLLEGFAAAIEEATRWMHANRTETLAIMGRMFPNVSPAVWGKAFDAFLPIFSADGRMTEAEMAAGYALYKELGIATAPPKASEGVTWTNAYLGK